MTSTETPLGYIGWVRMLPDVRWYMVAGTIAITETEARARLSLRLPVPGESKVVLSDGVTPVARMGRSTL